MFAGGGGGGGDSNNDAPDEEGGDGQCINGTDIGGSNIDPYASGGAGFSHNSNNGKIQSFLNGSVSSSYTTNGITSHGAFGGGGNSDDSAGGGGGFGGGDSTEKGGKGFGGTSFFANPISSCYQHNGSGFLIINFEKIRVLCTHYSSLSNYIYFISLFII